MIQKYEHPNGAFIFQEDDGKYYAGFGDKILGEITEFEFKDLASRIEYMKVI